MTFHDELKRKEIEKLIKQGIAQDDKWLADQDPKLLQDLNSLSKQLGLDTNDLTTDPKKATPAPKPAAHGDDVKTSVGDKAKSAQVYTAESKSSMKTFMQDFLTLLQNNKDLKFGTGKDSNLNVETKVMDGKTFIIIKGDKANDPSVKAFVDKMVASGVVKKASEADAAKILGLDSSQATQKNAPAAASTAPTPLPTTPSFK